MAKALDPLIAGTECRSRRASIADVFFTVAGGEASDTRLTSRSQRGRPLDGRSRASHSSARSTDTTSTSATAAVDADAANDDDEGEEEDSLDRSALTRSVTHDPPRWASRVSTITRRVGRGGGGGRIRPPSSSSSSMGEVVVAAAMTIGNVFKISNYDVVL